MMSNYDLQQTCRTCLHQTDNLIPLNKAPQINGSSDTEPITNKTTGDMMMECANVEFEINDGLPQNVCINCVSALRDAFAYKLMCEKSDAKLRQIFQLRLFSARVKLERIDEVNDNEIACPVEEHWFEDSTSAPFDSFSQKSSVSGDSWSVGDAVFKGKIEPTFDEIAASKGTNGESCIKIEKSCDNRNQSNENDDGDETLKNAKCEDDRLVCDTCNMSFLNHGNLKRHLQRQSHMNRHRKLQGSEIIKFNRGPIQRLKKKKAAKNGDEEDVKIVARAQCVDGRWLCEICNNSYCDRTTLKIHIRVHLGINLKQCPFCERGFGKQCYLNAHIKRDHPKDFPCRECKNVFDTKEALRLHTTEVHRTAKTDKKYICEICSRIFNKMNNLNQHRLTHTGEKNFSCDICKGKYTTKQVIKAHMRKHGDRSNYYRHICPHCGDKFTTTAHLAGHIRSKHTGEKPYKCEPCGLAFHRYDNWAQHKLKHVPRFICTICGKSLSSKFRLINHTRLHTGEKLECTICDQSFSQPKSLKSHLQRHSGEMTDKCNLTSADVKTSSPI